MNFFAQCIANVKLNSYLYITKEKKEYGNRINEERLSWDNGVHAQAWKDEKGGELLHLSNTKGR
jgi:hypothetical protein